MTELADEQSKILFPETIDGDVDEYIHGTLQNFFNIDYETSTLLSSYISGIVEDAGNDPFEAGESIEVLLRDSIDDNKLEVHISKFANQLVQHQIKKPIYELSCYLARRTIGGFPYVTSVDNLLLFKHTI